jgi:hypothetical protein
MLETEAALETPKGSEGTLGRTLLGGPRQGLYSRTGLIEFRASMKESLLTALWSARLSEKLQTMYLSIPGICSCTAKRQRAWVQQTIQYWVQ